MEEPNIVKAQQFTDEIVDIDGTAFEGCTFTRCTLRYSGGLPFHFDGGRLEESQIVFEGAARNTLNTLQGMRKTGLEALVDQILGEIRGAARSAGQ